MQTRKGVRRGKAKTATAKIKKACVALRATITQARRAFDTAKARRGRVGDIGDGLRALDKAQKMAHSLRKTYGAPIASCGNATLTNFLKMQSAADRAVLRK